MRSAVKTDCVHLLSLSLSQALYGDGNEKITKNNTPEKKNSFPLFFVEGSQNETSGESEGRQNSTSYRLQTRTGTI